MVEISGLKPLEVQKAMLPVLSVFQKGNFTFALCHIYSCFTTVIPPPPQLGTTTVRVK